MLGCSERQCLAAVLKREKHETVMHIKKKYIARGTVSTHHTQFESKLFIDNIHPDALHVWTKAQMLRAAAWCVVCQNVTVNFYTSKFLHHAATFSSSCLLLNA